MAVVVAMVIGSGASCPAWELVEVDGLEYVTLDSVKQFYQFDTISRKDRSVVIENRSVEMKLKIGQRDCFMNNVKFVLCREFIESDSKLLVSRIDLAKLFDPVLRPHYLTGAADFRTLVVDPGHGGEDAGFSNELGTESGYTLRVAEILKPLLEKRGFKVLLTRDGDRELSGQQRVEIANGLEGEAIFVGIHFSEGQKDQRGIRTFRMAPQGVPHFSRALRDSDFDPCIGNTHDPANVALAAAVHASVLRRLGSNTFDRGIQCARFEELRILNLPAIWIEGGFLSHPDEARLIHSEAYQKALANGIVDAVLKFRHAVGRAKVAGSPEVDGEPVEETTPTGSGGDDPPTNAEETSDDVKVPEGE